VITYDLSIKKATYKKLKNNTYEVKVIVTAQRYMTNENGKEDKISINELINVAVFNSHPKNFTKNETLYLKSHLINDSKIEFSCIVNEVPKYINIDPYYTRLDRTISDNIKMIIPE